jgi:predicted nucleotide-binding protein
MTNPLIARSPFEQLKQRFERGTQVALESALTYRQVSVWTASVRSPLKSIYGEDHKILEEWPPANILLNKTGDPREQLTAKLQRLQKTISVLEDAGSDAKVDAQPTHIGTKVFIGHGQSLVWRVLKEFLQDSLKLPVEEFNQVSVAGITNTARLSDMLDSAVCAFVIMTAEDEMGDGRTQARMNVIHEVGLCQGRLGFNKTFVLLEDGCEEFSNIQGLGQIRFPKGNVKAAFEDIREALKREINTNI